MRLDIRYTMRFRYSGPVREAHNAIRVRPQDRPEQHLLDYRLTTIPVARVLSFTDYWGTAVDHFGHAREHDRLDVIAESAVETRLRAPITAASADTVNAGRFVLDHAEFLEPSAHVESDSEIAALARDAASGADDAQGAMAAIVAATRSRLRYEPGSTRIGIPLNELVAGGRGVCQDFAHLCIGMLRAVGIPARYVSGYLFAADDASGSAPRSGERASTAAVEVQTHAWVEAALPGQGWQPVDPTNDRVVGERHVVIGVGRDYDDVAPVRGVYQGDATPEVDATVEIRRMEPVERPMSVPRWSRSPFQPAGPAPSQASAAQQQ